VSYSLGLALILENLLIAIGIATMQRCAGCAFDIEGVAPEASL
jgi:hypothetical protein